MSIGELTSIYDRKELDIHPEFQRYYRWSDQQKSDLIESILLGIPLPSLFVSQREDGVWDVVDGLQRLSTIFQFQHRLRNEDGSFVEPLVLEEPTYLSHLKGKRYPADAGRSDNQHNFISEALALDFRRAKVDLKIILRSSDPGQEYDLFQRLNTGGSQLSEQEVRNNLLIMANRADFRKLKELAETETFQDTLSLSERLQDEQYDLELALRFLIMHKRSLEEMQNLRDLSKFLNTTMLDLTHKKRLVGKTDIDAFKSTFALLSESLGEDSFRRYDPSKRRYSGGFLVSAFEVIALGLGYHIDAWADEPNAVEEIRKRVKLLWQRGRFLAQPRMGVAASVRVPLSIGEGRKAFEP